MPRLSVLHLAASCAGALVVARLAAVAAPMPTMDRDAGYPMRFGPADSLAQADAPRPFEIPPYGNPPGSGAGKTGFDSTNRPARKSRTSPQTRGGARAARPKTIAPRHAPAPVAAVRPMPQLERRGSSLIGEAAQVPLSAGVPLPHRRRLPEDDALAPLGARVGSFLFRPALEVSGGFDTNPTHTMGGKSSSLVVVAPELQVRSDWSRHALNADIRGSYTAYGRSFGDSGTPVSLDRPNLDARVNGRLDVTATSRVEGEGRVLESTDNPGSPNIQAGLSRLPVVTTAGATLGYSQRFNRFEATVKGSIDRSVYEQSHLTDGSTDSNDDRNVNQYAGALRGSYEVTPGVKPFVEAGLDTRVHDLPIDRTGTQRDSTGAVARLGTTFEITRILTGELSGGYLTRSYKDPLLPSLGGLIFDASLIWTASALTVATLTAKSSVDETIVTGVSGTLRRDFGVAVDHAFRRWLTATVKLGYGIDQYVGSPREDHRYFASALMTYKLNRTVQIKGELRQDWLKSSVNGADYTATAMLAGMRFQL